jgi:hypothetical protein
MTAMPRRKAQKSGFFSGAIATVSGAASVGGGSKPCSDSAGLRSWWRTSPYDEPPLRLGRRTGPLKLLCCDTERDVTTEPTRDGTRGGRCGGIGGEGVVVFVAVRAAACGGAVGRWAGAKVAIRCGVAVAMRGRDQKQLEGTRGPYSLTRRSGRRETKWLAAAVGGCRLGLNLQYTGAANISIGI